MPTGTASLRPDPVTGFRFAALRALGGGQRLLSGDPVRELVIHTIVRAGVIAAVAFGLDALASLWVTPLASIRLDAPNLTPGEARGSRAITYFLGYVGVLPAVVVALTSLAVATVGAYGSPSLLMLTPSYSRRWWDHALYPVVGRTSRFQRALILSMGLTASLLGLAGGAQVGWIQNQLPTLLFLAGLFLAALFSVLVFVIWLVDLRRPSQVAFATWRLADNILSHIEDCGKNKRALTPYVWRGVASPYPSAYREQEHLKRCIYALTELAVRTMADRQRFTARESITVLSRISKQYRSLKSRPREWDDLRRDRADPIGELPAPDIWWFERVLVEAFESIAVAAAELHYMSVARDAARELMVLTLHLAVQHPGKDSSALRLALVAFVDLLDECAQFREATVLEVVLRPATRAFGIVAKSARRNPTTLARLHDHLVSSMRLAVTNDDVVGLRALLTILTRLRIYSSTRSIVIAAAIDLGATALASRRYQAASILIDWFLPGRGGSELIAVGASEREGGLSQRAKSTPSYVGQDYVELFVLLAASRVTQITQAPLVASDHAAVDRLVAPLPDADRRARFVCERMAHAVAYPEEEVKGWLSAVTEFTDPHEHAA